MFFIELLTNKKESQERLVSVLKDITVMRAKVKANEPLTGEKQSREGVTGKFQYSNSPNQRQKDILLQELGDKKEKLQSIKREMSKSCQQQMEIYDVIKKRVHLHEGSDVKNHQNDDDEDSDVNGNGNTRTKEEIAKESFGENTPMKISMFDEQSQAHQNLQKIEKKILSGDEQIFRTCFEDGKGHQMKMQMEKPYKTAQDGQGFGMSKKMIKLQKENAERAKEKILRTLKESEKKKRRARRQKQLEKIELNKEIILHLLGRSIKVEKSIREMNEKKAMEVKDKQQQKRENIDQNQNQNGEKMPIQSGSQAKVEETAKRDFLKQCVESMQLPFALSPPLTNQNLNGREDIGEQDINQNSNAVQEGSIPEDLNDSEMEDLQNEMYMRHYHIPHSEIPSVLPALGQVQQYRFGDGFGNIMGSREMDMDERSNPIREREGDQWEMLANFIQNQVKNRTQRSNIHKKIDQLSQLTFNSFKNENTFDSSDIFDERLFMRMLRLDEEGLGLGQGEIDDTGEKHQKKVNDEREKFSSKKQKELITHIDKNSGRTHLQVSPSEPSSPSIYETECLLECQLYRKMFTICDQIQRNNLQGLQRFIYENSHMINKAQSDIEFWVSVCSAVNMLATKIPSEEMKAIELIRQEMKKRGEQIKTKHEKELHKITSMLLLSEDQIFIKPYLTKAQNCFKHIFQDIYRLFDCKKFIKNMFIGGLILKTPTCTTKHKQNMMVCPMCSPLMQEIFKKVPILTRNHSNLICRVDGSMMGEENCPIMLPSKQIYSFKGLESKKRAFKDEKGRTCQQYYCQVTRTYYPVERARKVFLT